MARIRLRANARQARRILVATRVRYSASVDVLAVVPVLTADDRRILRSILRTSALQWAALELSHRWWGYNLVRLLSAVTCVVVPIWLIVSRVQNVREGAAASVAYILVGGTLALVYGVQQRTTRWPLPATAATLVGTVTIMAVTTGSSDRDAWRWHGAQVGTAAAVIFAVLVILRLLALRLVRRSIFRPWAARQAGWLLSPQLAAVHLLGILHLLHIRRNRCRHPRFRGDLIRVLNSAITGAVWEIRHATPALGFGAAVSADAATKARRLTAHLHRLQIRLANDHNFDEYDRVTMEAGQLTAALAHGDWAVITTDEAADDGESTRRWLSRSLLPAAILATTAAALPHLPGVPSGSPATVSVQIGLAIAAALSLTPVDPTNREHLLSAVAHATRRNP